MQARQMAHPENILDKLIKITIEKLGVKEDEVKANSSFVEDFGADSLDTVQMVAAIEEAFGIEIEDEKVESMVTVEKAVEVIEELLKEKA
ncbi:unnamed protein product [Eruca vesicaria subsp. sativa]|uniref:Acyl carrier protein n=1 Tax=Eruca vesicaria subsp. sativa TaxID=29727 RepID=A0ABC8IWQ6_ERUVS|nr:unnamed protein product [Eruca vesicaria subsp. sativa]